jgi:hypothetical protein
VGWPNDVDGDVFRRLADDGFDFSREHAIDFNVDFKNWPPPEEALAAIRVSYPEMTSYPPEDGDAGYVHVRVHDLLTYEIVMRTQKDLSDRTAQFDGTCESWGVFNDRTQSK